MRMETRREKQMENHKEHKSALTPPEELNNANVRN